MRSNVQCWLVGLTPHPRDKEHFAEVQHGEDLEEAGGLQRVLQVLHVERQLGRVDEVNDLLQAYSVNPVKLDAH